jgi:hypothetical protein
LKDGLQTAREARQAKEKDMVKAGKYPTYPSWESIEAELDEAAPAVYLEIRDASGDFVKRVAAKAKKGLHRVTWDMTVADPRAVRTAKPRDPRGTMAPPGTYSATLMQRVRGEVTQLAGPVEFDLVPIREGALAGASYEESAAYAEELAAAQRRSSAASGALNELEDQLEVLRVALDRTPGDVTALEATYAEIRSEMQALGDEFSGLESRQGMGVGPATIASRLQFAASGTRTSYGPTAQHREQFGYALEALNDAAMRIAALVEDKVPAFQRALVEAGAPWTPGAALPR